MVNTRAVAESTADKKDDRDAATLLRLRSKKRTSRKRGLSSPHFRHVVSSDAAVTPPKALPVKGRSAYFKSSPDSCVGSATSFDWGSAFTERAVDAFRACPKFELSGVRHLCERLCYLRAYEPCRKWHALRSAVARAGAPTSVLTGWSVRMDGGRGEECSWRISYISPDGDVFPSAKPALTAVGLSQSASERSSSPPSVRRRSRTPPRSSQAPTDTPSQTDPRGKHVCGPAYLLKEAPSGSFPPSPFGLIEELLADDPWRVLLGCIMLNQTTRAQMDPVLVRFLEKFPTAATAAAASVGEIAQVVGPLGLQERRPAAIVRFSQEYTQKAWKDPEELYWIGKYAGDAHKIFIERKWRDYGPTTTLSTGGWSG